MRAGQFAQAFVVQPTNGLGRLWCFYMLKAFHWLLQLASTVGEVDYAHTNVTAVNIALLELKLHRSSSFYKLFFDEK